MTQKGNEEKWLEEFEVALLHEYAIDIEDTGWDRTDLYSSWSAWPPAVAVGKFGDKYGLSSLKGIF